MKTICKSLLFFAVFAATACQADAPFFPKLVVSGNAVLQKPADVVTMNVTIITQSESAEKALKKNNAKIQDVVNNLQELGLEKGEYFTGQFTIQPQYTPYPHYPPADWKPAIIGYEVNNTLTIKTQKLDLIASVIDAAGRAGVDQISSLSFSIRDPQMYRSEVITSATSNALRDAQALADTANVKIVRVLDITLDVPQVYPRATHNMYMGKAEALPFIEAPDVDLRANVSIMFEICSR